MSLSFTWGYADLRSALDAIFTSLDWVLNSLTLTSGTALTRLASLYIPSGLSRFGLAVRSWAGKQKDLGSIPLRFSFLFKCCGSWTVYFVTLPLTINYTLTWLSPLPMFM